MVNLIHFTWKNFLQQISCYGISWNYDWCWHDVSYMSEVHAEHHQGRHVWYPLYFNLNLFHILFLYLTSMNILINFKLTTNTNCKNIIKNLTISSKCCFSILITMLFCNAFVGHKLTTKDLQWHKWHYDVNGCQFLCLQYANEVTASQICHSCIIKFDFLWYNYVLSTLKWRLPLSPGPAYMPFCQLIPHVSLRAKHLMMSPFYYVSWWVGIPFTIILKWWF